MNNFARHIISLLTTLTAALAFVSCEMDATDILVDASDPSVVVCCLASPGEPLCVEAYTSVAYYDSVSRRPIGEALVSLSCGGKTHEARLASGELSVLFPDVVPSVGDSLSLSIAHDGGLAYSSFSIPTYPVVLGLDTTSARRDSNTLVLSLQIKDLPDTDDFYEVMILRRSWQNGVATDEEVEGDFVSNFFAGTQNSILDGQSILGLFSDEYFSSSSPVVVFQCSRDNLRAAPDVADSTTIVVRTFHHSADMFYFRLTSSYSQRSVLLPIFTSTSVHSNVIGGLGITAGVVYSDITPGRAAPPEHRPFLRSPEYFSNN